MKKSQYKLRSWEHDRFDQIVFVARKHGWKIMTMNAHQISQKMLSFKKTIKENDMGEVRINYWIGKATMSIALNHPKRGKNQAYKKGVYDKKVMEALFINPRQHTTGGYRKKKKKIFITETRLKK